MMLIYGMRRQQFWKQRKEETTLTFGWNGRTITRQPFWKREGRKDSNSHAVAFNDKYSANSDDSAQAKRLSSKMTCAMIPSKMTMPPKRAMIPLKAKAMPPKAMIPSKRTMPPYRAMMTSKNKTKQ